MNELIWLWGSWRSIVNFINGLIGVFVWWFGSSFNLLGVINEICIVFINVGFRVFNFSDVLDVIFGDLGGN